LDANKNWDRAKAVQRHHIDEVTFLMPRREKGYYHFYIFFLVRSRNSVNSVQTYFYLAASMIA